MRATEKKRRPFMTARKWITMSVAFILIIIFLLVMYYRNIQAETWDEQQYVKSSLREYFNPITIDYAKKYIWDEVYWIVKGKTAQDIEKYIVWQDLNIILSNNTNELLTEKQMISQLESKDASIEIKHIQPAYFREMLAFEVQSKVESGHTLYTFYKMEDGKLIDQFTMPK